MNIITNNYNRICVGSDWPEFSHKSFLNQLKILFKEIDNHKIKKITHQNILEYIG